MPTALRALVFVSGEALSDHVLSRVVPHLPTDALGIGADSGVDHARRLRLPIHVAVGDFDSVSVEGLDAVVAAGAVVERHRPDKDATDLELALDAALERGVEHVTVVGGSGGRLDQVLANLLVIASPKYATMRVDAWYGEAFVSVTRDAVHLVAERGRRTSLLAVHGPAGGVTTRGLRYPLRRETLHAGSTRGLSNELVDDAADVTLTDGTLLTVQDSPSSSPLLERLPDRSDPEHRPED
jgi:thiamine pyrophosphokinase